MFFVSLLLNEIVGWMRSQRGTSSLRALVYFDEIFGFLPPVANPPSKPPLLTLLETGARVWPGRRRRHAEPRRPRLQGAVQRRHVDAGPSANRSGQSTRLGRSGGRRRNRRRGVRSVAARPLALVARETPVPSAQRSRTGSRSLFETRWALSYLRGPLGREEIKRLTSQRSKCSKCSKRSKGGVRTRYNSFEQCPWNSWNPWNHWNRADRRSRDRAVLCPRRRRIHPDVDGRRPRVRIPTPSWDSTKPVM